MRIDLSVKHWFNIVCIMVLLPFSHLALSNYSKLDPPAALALIDENGHAEIPDTYTSISADAFRESNLKSVTIPNTIASIGEFAFYRTKLTSVVIPASTVSIDSYAFYSSNCLSIEEANAWGDGVDTYNGCLKLDQVTFASDSMLETIGSYAFAYNDLSLLELPDSIIEINHDAFIVNENLVSIDFGESLEYIASYAFAYCNKLEAVSFPSSLKSIDHDAFSYTRLTSIDIPDSVINIDQGAFGYGGQFLESVVIGDSLEYIQDRLFENQKNLHTVVIGDAVTTIGEGAFKSAPISSLTIGANVTNIGENAFNAVSGDVFILKPAQENFDIYNFSSMANVYACDSLDDAGNPQGCEQAYLNATYTKLDPPAALALIDENGHAEIPDTYTSISADAFRESNLKSVTIPNTIASIGEFAFYRTKLTSVVIPASTVSIDSYAFYSSNCLSIEEANAWGDGVDTYNGCLKLDQVTFASDSMLETIGSYAFAYNDLSLLELPDSIIEINHDAFIVNENLVSIDFGESLEYIASYAFAYCNKLEAVSFPSSLKSIDHDAFSYTRLTSIDIPDSVINIDQGAFGYGGQFLESVVIGDSLEYIQDRLFENQKNLHTVVIGDAVTTIGEGAFKSAPISSLTIGANVTNIGENAFNAVSGDVFILKPAQENFDIYNFSSMANVYACDSLDDEGNPQNCSDAWPDDGIDVPEWPINICDSDSSLPECDPCTLDPDACDPCAINLEMCEDPCAYDAQSCDPCITDPDSCSEVPDLMTQNISVTNSPKGILGKTAVLEVSYDTSDSNNQLTGIGMRVHFNSSLLGFKEITNLIEQDIIVSGDGPHNDEDDFDNDPLTDQYISFGWASLFGNWPNVELPSVLMNIAFDVFDTIDTDAIAETNINFSKTAFTVGYEFEAENYNLELKTASWDFDGNGHADALTDGLMMLRYCFGLRGDSVTTSAMSIDSPMSSEQVVAEIESALDMADIDDDGEVRALTDGLILLRYLFDLRGDQLTAATVSLTANRSSNEAIEAYIEAYMP